VKGAFIYRGCGWVQIGSVHHEFGRIIMVVVVVVVMNAPSGVK
jgi:hypothetical protein